MNRLDTMIAADTPLITGATHLLPERLESWDADDLALAIALAQAPASVGSDLGDGLLHLMVADERLEDALAVKKNTNRGTKAQGNDRENKECRLNER